MVLKRSDEVYDREFSCLCSSCDCFSKQELNDNATDTDVKRFISFYFTNVPKFIPYAYLQQGFEVCGILEDLYLAKNYNAQGKVYGFVRLARSRMLLS